MKSISEFLVDKFNNDNILVNDKAFPPDDEIWYTTNNQEKINLNDFPLIESNTYDKDKNKGILKAKSDSVINIIYKLSFADCKNLVSVRLPKTVNYIAFGAFYSCSSLKDINIDNVNSFGDGAFRCCYNLKSSIKEKIKKIMGKSKSHDNPF